MTDDTDTPEFVDGADFESWFSANQDSIYQLLRNDPEQLLYEAWLCGYQNGLDYMLGQAKPIISG